MDAVIRLMVRLHDQSVLIRINGRGAENGAGENLGIVELMKELVMERLANWAEICINIWVLVSSESSESLEYVSITNVDRTAENKPA